jgi:hypothetical protein
VVWLWHPGVGKTRGGKGIARARQASRRGQSSRAGEYLIVRGNEQQIASIIGFGHVVCEVKTRKGGSIKKATSTKRKTKNSNWLWLAILGLLCADVETPRPPNHSPTASYLRLPTHRLPVSGRHCSSLVRASLYPCPPSFLFSASFIPSAFFCSRFSQLFRSTLSRPDVVSQYLFLLLHYSPLPKFSFVFGRSPTPLSHFLPLTPFPAPYPTLSNSLLTYFDQPFYP